MNIGDDVEVGRLVTASRALRAALTQLNAEATFGAGIGTARHRTRDGIVQLPRRS